MSYLKNFVTYCGYAIIERVVMSKRKASDIPPRDTKKPNKSSDFVYYQSASQ